MATDETVWSDTMTNLSTRTLTMLIGAGLLVWAFALLSIFPY